MENLEEANEEFGNTQSVSENQSTSEHQPGRRPEIERSREQLVQQQGSDVSGHRTRKQGTGSSYTRQQSSRETESKPQSATASAGRSSSILHSFPIHSSAHFDNPEDELTKALLETHHSRSGDMVRESLLSVFHSYEHKFMSLHTQRSSPIDV